VTAAGIARNAHQQRVLVLGNPKFDARFLPLPEAEAEARVVSAALRTEAVLGAKIRYLICLTWSALM
jgi:hypothetical protein